MDCICISDAVPAALLSSLQAQVPELSFSDGAASAGWHASRVKRNLQARPDARSRVLQRQLVDALSAHPMIQSAALPAAIAPPLFARYGPGDGYGGHVDDAVMQQGRFRSDLSVTVFLSDPDGYSGGALELQGRSDALSIKLPAGHAVLYPATSLHRVEPVTEGVRLVAVTWIQSLVRDAAARDVLLDIDEARRSVFAAEGKSDAFDRLSRAYANLLRRWAEPAAMP